MVALTVMEERKREAILASEEAGGRGGGRDGHPQHSHGGRGGTHGAGGAPEGKGGGPGGRRGPWRQEGPQKGREGALGAGGVQGIPGVLSQLAGAWGKLPRKYTESCSATIQLDRSGGQGVRGGRARTLQFLRRRAMEATLIMPGVVWEIQKNMFIIST